MSVGAGRACSGCSWVELTEEGFTARLRRGLVDGIEVCVVCRSPSFKCNCVLPGPIPRPGAP